MLTSSSPFSTAQTQSELIQMVRSGKLPALPAQYSSALKNVIKAMLTLNASQEACNRTYTDGTASQASHHQRFIGNGRNETASKTLHCSKSVSRCVVCKCCILIVRASILMTKKDELRQMEEKLAARALALDAREKTIAVREVTVSSRETACALKEEENRGTSQRLNAAAEQLRGHWDKLRVEKEREKEVAVSTIPITGDERVIPRRASIAPTRPPLEERNTVPLPAISRLPRHPAYEDTPSKIPMAIAAVSPAPLERAQGTPLRRAATKSLGNIGSAYREQATPAKQTIPFPGRQRTSIGSPSELHCFNEDVSMASPAPSSIGSPAPFMPRPRRSSVAPGSLISQPNAIASGSSSDSVSASDQENIPPTMIPAPTNAFVYREAATPAKWTPEDPDLPSPFLRRAVTAPVPQERQPLGSIAIQPPAVSLNSLPAPNGNIIKAKTNIPRSRSGNLHQHVLKANAHARTSGEGVRQKATTAGGTAARTIG